eukprot:4442359-Amphidinium_carterae.1
MGTKRGQNCVRSALVRYFFQLNIESFDAAKDNWSGLQRARDSKDQHDIAGNLSDQRQAVIILSARAPT